MTLSENCRKLTAIVKDITKDKGNCLVYVCSDTYLEVRDPITADNILICSSPMSPKYSISKCQEIILTPIIKRLVDLVEQNKVQILYATQIPLLQAALLTFCDPKCDEQIDSMACVIGSRLHEYIKGSPAFKDNIHYKELAINILVDLATYKLPESIYQGDSLCQTVNEAYCPEYETTYGQLVIETADASK